MRQRTTEINFRVYKSEKEQIRRKAKKAGMTASDYLRSVALGAELKTAPTEEFISVYQLIKEIHDEFRWDIGFNGLSKKFDTIENMLLNLYHGEVSDKSNEGVDAYGGNKNMTN